MSRPPSVSLPSDAQLDRIFKKVKEHFPDALPESVGTQGVKFWHPQMDILAGHERSRPQSTLFGGQSLIGGHK